MIVVKHEIEPQKIINGRGSVSGVDIGVNNLATSVTNKRGDKPFIINGRPLKSINQFYNKELARLRSDLDLCSSKRGKKKLCAQIDKLCRKRNLKVEDYLHKASTMSVNQLVSQGVSTLIVGKNDLWKQ